MNAVSRSIDAGSKRWLAVLAATVAASVIFMVYSVIQTLSPSRPTVVAPQKPASAGEPATRTEPDWNAAHAGQGLEVPAAREDPFAAQEAAAAKAAAAHDPVARQQDVHRQAEYLRGLISQGKLPSCFGKLTKEQVDQMEKNGLTIQ